MGGWRKRNTESGAVKNVAEKNGTKKYRYGVGQKQMHSKQEIEKK